MGFKFLLYFQGFIYFLQYTQSYLNMKINKDNFFSYCSRKIAETCYISKLNSKYKKITLKNEPENK